MEELQIEENLGMPIYLSRISGCVQYKLYDNMSSCDCKEATLLVVVNYVMCRSCMASFSTGPNWTPLDVPGHLQGTSMLHVVLLVPSPDRSTHCYWWGVDSVKL